MLNNILVTNYLGETLTMDLRNPEKSGFLVYNVTGIGPNKATINSTELSTNDGAVYNSARIESRNIVISIIFKGDDTIENYRHKLYKYFPIKKKIRLEFHTNNRKCYINGYVESNEISIFSAMESTQISIICPDPFFYSTDINITKFYSVESGFEFPFEDDILRFPSLNFGEISSTDGKSIYYTGDAEVGMIIEIHATGIVSDLAIYNTETRESMHIDSSRLIEITGSDISEADTIIISTIKGNKTVTLLRSGKRTNILNALDRDADWLMLSKGDNVFAYTASSGVENLQFTITNPIVYEGL